MERTLPLAGYPPGGTRLSPLAGAKAGSNVEIQMQLPQDTVIAVADGEKLSLFQNEGNALNVKRKRPVKPSLRFPANT